MRTEVIAIDGPAGAGKSTVAKAVARELGFRYLDTGAMYRSVAVIAERKKVPPDDEDALARLAANISVKFLPGDPQRVIVNGEDLSEAIRSPEIGEAASAVSVFPKVRRELVKRQHRMAAAGRVVLEGRDTTTVVCPDARLKVYLTASAKERARRRWLDLTLASNGAEVPTLEEVERRIALRDRRDMSREDSPLKISDDALVIDTDEMTVDQVVAAVLSAWRTTTGAC